MNRFRLVQATLEREVAKPYAYGNPDESDCFMMGCAMADALDGRQMVKAYGGSYSTLAGAQRALRKRGFTSLVDFWTVELGRPAIAPAEAQLGDLVVLLLDDGAEHVGICLGIRFVTKTPEGPRYFDLSSVSKAFHLG